MNDRALVIESVGNPAVRPVPRPDGPVLVRTLYSGVSAGTELTFLNGTNPALHSSFDPELGLFRPGEPAAAYPVTRLGYMEVARVEATAEDGSGPPVGALVAMTYGHRTGYAADPLRDRIVELPAELDPILGIYVAHMGPICANGLLHAAVELCGTDARSLGDGVRGLRVVVVGGGVIGLLTALFATHHEAAEVVVPIQPRNAGADDEQLGLRAVDPDDGDPRALKRWRHRRDRGRTGLPMPRRTPRWPWRWLIRPQGTVRMASTRQRHPAAEGRVPPQRVSSGAPRRAVPPRHCASLGPERLSGDGPCWPSGPAVRSQSPHRPARRRPRMLTDWRAPRHVIQAVLTRDKPSGCRVAVPRPSNPVPGRDVGLMAHGVDLSMEMTTVERSGPCRRTTGRGTEVTCEPNVDVTAAPSSWWR